MRGLFGWDLPPGVRGCESTTIEYRCDNDDCPVHQSTRGKERHQWEVAAYREFGAITLKRDEDGCCPECGSEGTPV